VCELVTIIIPCRNEGSRIRACLNSVLAFKTPENVDVEVLVLDGMSADRTREVIKNIARRESRVRLVDNPGRTPPCAMNIGIKEAAGRWILRLDAHTEYPPDYLLKCYETARRTGAHNTGGICITRPGGERYAARLVQALMSHKFGVGNSGFRTGVSAGPRDTVPFGFFCKKIFDHVGLFDERLARTQDYEFNRRLVAMGGLIFLDPSIVSYYYSPASLTGVLKKFLRRQGPYVAYMWYLAPHAFSWRHAVPAAFVVGFVGLVALSLLWHAFLWCLVAMTAIYSLLALAASVDQALRHREPLHLVCLPPSFLAYHLSYGTGVVVGLLRLLLRRSPVQKVREPWPGAGGFRVRIWKAITSRGCSG